MTRAEAMVMGEFSAPLRFEEREMPGLEPGAVVADVLYAGVCGTDVHLHAGQMDIAPPLVLGHEAVGTVRALDAQVEEDALGQPLREGDVIGWASSIACGNCRACREGEPTLCDARRVYGISQGWREWPYFSGGWASAIYLQAGTTLAKPPANVPPLAVIALGCAGPTVVHGLRQIGDLSGQAVIVQGAGPVGIASALFARQRGARKVLLIGGPSARVALARDLGVGDVWIELDAEADVERRAARARELLGDDRGADVVIEATGSPAAVAEGIDLCRPNGRYLVLGQYTDRGPTLINPHLVTRKQLTVRGSWAFSGEDYLDYLAALPELQRTVDLTRLVEVFPLADAGAALEAVKRGDVLKAVLASSAGLERLQRG